MNSDNSVERKLQLELWIKQHFNLKNLQLSSISGDAGFRQYYRFCKGDISYIAVDAPPKTENSQAFVAMAEAYASQSVMVPHIIFADYQLGFMCLDDLGDELLLDRLASDNVATLYAQALSLLTKTSLITSTTHGALPEYDHAFFMREMKLFDEWFLPYLVKLEVAEKTRLMLEQLYQLLAKSALEQPKVGVHRDFHSRNIMMIANDRMAVIDFQDAVVGPITYDAVSLLRDCYINWPDDLIYRQLSLFKDIMSEPYPELRQIEEAQFERWFDWMGLQRHIKVCGIFSRLHHRDGKSGYLKDIPRVLQYILEVAKKYQSENPVFESFVTWLELEVQPVIVSSKPS